MAEPYDTLLAVQEHDTVLDQLRHRIDAMPERAELDSVERTRAAVASELASVRALVDDLAARQGALEQQIATAAARRHDLERRMHSGEPFAPRDLEAMDHEVGQLATRQSQLEDEELALLEEEDPLDTTLAAHEARAAELEAERDRLQAAVAAAEVELRAAIEAESAQRAERAAALPSELAERYERLRAHLGGVGAARLVGDRCDGCHLTLPSVDVERIRHLPPNELATCAQCDRILVH
jgi:uncharacterized protein